MTETLAEVVVQIENTDHLVEIFGLEASRQAFDDFEAEMASLFTRVLAQHETITTFAKISHGRVDVALGHVLSGGLPRDAEETCLALQAAARKLMHSVTSQVFGAGTALQVQDRLDIVPITDSHIVGEAEALRAWLDTHLAERPMERFWDQDIAVADVTSVMNATALRTMLQPIVRMRDRKLLGFEALVRGPAGHRLERPDLLFDAAHAYGLSETLELLCAQLALERTQGRLPEGLIVTINLGPESLARAADELPLTGRIDVMFELTEHMPLDEAEGLVDAVQRLRAMGVGLALDDTGCGFADLDTARVLRPDIVKLCITIIRNADKGSPFLSAIGETTQALHDLGCRVLAEGVETEAQHQHLDDCGIELAQGWLYARPEPVDDALKHFATPLNCA